MEKGMAGCSLLTFYIEEDKTMKSRFISMLCVTATIFASSAVLAETVIVECPKVYTTNPFTLQRVENGEGWEKSESSAYNLFNRCGVDPQGYMKCYYGAAAHGASDLYMLKKMPPANTVCKESSIPSIPCKFECTPKQASQQPIKIQPVQPVKKR